MVIEINEVGICRKNRLPTNSKLNLYDIGV